MVNSSLHLRLLMKVPSFAKTVEGKSERKLARGEVGEPGKTARAALGFVLGPRLGASGSHHAVQLRNCFKKNT